MKVLVFVSLLYEIVIEARCESDLNDDTDQRFVPGIAAKIGFPTVLKVLIKGDIQPEEIEKVLELCSREETPNGSDLARNRRNSISDYIGKLYTFNNMFRPARSIFRSKKRVQTTKIPWLKKILGVNHKEPRTEDFWGLALDAHTFRPLVRPLTKTRMPYHRFRDQQRIDRLLGITRDYGVFPTSHAYKEKMPTERNEDQTLLEERIGQAKSEQVTKILSENQNVTSRKPFHRAPLEVAGLNRTLIPHLHAFTTPRRLKFCEKQCVDEPDEASTREAEGSNNEEPTTVGDDSNSDHSYSSTTCEASDKCVKAGETDCQEFCSNVASAGTEMPQHVAQNKHKHSTRKPKSTTFRVQTSRFTKHKEHRSTGLVWSLPPNSVLEKEITMEEEKRLSWGTKATRDTHTTVTPSIHLSSTEDYRTTLCNPQGTNRHDLCTPLPIPTRKRLPACPERPKTTRRRTELCSSSTNKCEPRQPVCKGKEELDECTHKPKTTILCNTPHQKKCGCQHPRPNHHSNCNMQSSSDSSEDRNRLCTCSKNTPQKIIVRIPSKLGEVPVVIMRDNGVSGVSLTLVNEHLLDENNRLIKCLTQPMSGMNLDVPKNAINNVQVRKKCRQFPSHLIRHQLHGLQPKRYSMNFGYNPQQKVAAPRAFNVANGRGSHVTVHEKAVPGERIPNQFSGYMFNHPGPRLTELRSSGMQYPLGVQDLRGYHQFKMDPPVPPNGMFGHPLPQMEYQRLPGRINPLEVLGLGAQPGPDFGKLGLPAISSSALNLQPFYPPQAGASSQLLSYRSPFMPIFYQSKNDAQSRKYMMSGLP